MYNYVSKPQLTSIFYHIDYNMIGNTGNPIKSICQSILVQE
jgi:hypothetical protein